MQALELKRFLRNVHPCTRRTLYSRCYCNKNSFLFCGPSLVLSSRLSFPFFVYIYLLSPRFAIFLSHPSLLSLLISFSSRFLLGYLKPENCILMYTYVYLSFLLHDCILYIFFKIIFFILCHYQSKVIFL